MNNKIKQFELKPGYKISRVEKGSWQLSGGHGEIDRKQAILDMARFVEAGITTFDVADIYTGAEEMIGDYLRTLNIEQIRDKNIRIHTKYVPDKSILSSITEADTVKIIDRSLQRLGLSCLDMVQFHWWDYNQPRYIETAQVLARLQKAGKIRFVSVTNFDTIRLKQILDAGISVETIQLQYSILDSRPDNSMINLCKPLGIKFLCYGTLAGGFLSNYWLDQPEPVELENRSLIKYKLIIDDVCGSWNTFQKLLKLLKEISKKHEVSISNIATKYVLQKSNVASVIIGNRNTNHLADTQSIFSYELDKSDIEQINSFISTYLQQLKGDCYDLERNDRRHSGIMKYNLNTKN